MISYGPAAPYGCPLLAGAREAISRRVTCALATPDAATHARRPAAIDRPNRRRCCFMASSLGFLELEREQRRAQRFRVCIQGKRARDFLAGLSLQDEIQRPKLRQSVAQNRAMNHRREQPLDPGRRDLALEPRVIERIERNDADVQDRALVARPRVSQLPQPHERHPLPIYTVSTSTRQTTRSRARDMDAMASTSRVAVTAPPPPAGPFVYSASTSRPMRAASSRVRVR